MRTTWKLSQAELAEKFGVTSPSFGRWENGTEPSYDTLVEIAKFFKISIDRLLTEELTPQTCPPRWGRENTEAQEREQDTASSVEMFVELVKKELAELRTEVAALKEGHRTK